MVSIAGLAYETNVEFSDILLHRGHKINTTEITDPTESNVFDVALKIIVDYINKIDEFTDEVNDISGAIADAVVDISALLNGTDVIESGIQDITDALDSVSAKYDNKTIEVNFVSHFGLGTNPIYFSCDFCSDISVRMANISAEITSQTSETFDDLADMKADVMDELIDKTDDIYKTIDDFLEVVTETRSDIVDIEKDIIDGRKDAVDYNNYRELAYNILFALPLLPVVLVILGGIFRKPVCFSCGYTLFWFSSFVMFFLLIFHWPIAVIINDTCDFININEQNVTGYQYDNYTLMFQSCLENTKLLVVLGYDKELDFGSKITFPSFGNLTDVFTFSAFDDFSAETESVNMSTFEEAGNDALVAINTLIPFCTESGCNSSIVITRDNFNSSFVDAADVDGYFVTNSVSWTSMANALDVLYAEIDTAAAFDALILDMQNDTESIVNLTNSVQNDTEKVVADLTDTDGLLKPIISETDDVIDIVRCGFVGHGYYAFTSILCSDFSSIILRCVVGMLAVGILSLIACCCGVKLVRRAFWIQWAKDPDHEDLIEMQANPKKFAIRTV